MAIETAANRVNLGAILTMNDTLKAYKVARNGAHGALKSS
jgi:hypothetical protein